jgi:hypothetical protein
MAIPVEAAVATTTIPEGEVEVVVPVTRVANRATFQEIAPLEVPVMAMAGALVGASADSRRHAMAAAR